jgi:hypothetical protein
MRPNCCRSSEMTQCPIPELHARAESGSTATGIVVNAARSKRAATGRRILQEPGRHGASPKSQSWLIYAPPANRAGPVLRAGLTDAFVTESGTDESESGIVRLGCRQILRLAPFEVVPMITYRKKKVAMTSQKADQEDRGERMVPDQPTEAVEAENDEARRTISARHLKRTRQQRRGRRGS